MSNDLPTLMCRFHPECTHGANAGLAKAREVLEPIKARFPWISYADLWTLGGVVAIESMGGEENKQVEAGHSDRLTGSATQTCGRWVVWWPSSPWEVSRSVCGAN